MKGSCICNILFNCMRTYSATNRKKTIQNDPEIPDIISQHVISNTTLNLRTMVHRCSVCGWNSYLYRSHDSRNYMDSKGSKHNRVYHVDWIHFKRIAGVLICNGVADRFNQYTLYSQYIDIFIFINFSLEMWSVQIDQMNPMTANSISTTKLATLQAHFMD